MKAFKQYKQRAKIHFIGVGGISVSALAEHALLRGNVVSGSEKKLNAQAKRLANLGVKIYAGHSAKNVCGVDLVVYSCAIDYCNCELVKAKELGIPTVRRSKYLGGILKKYKNCVCIAGSHGKTTATAMLSQIFIADNKNPTVFLGGNYGAFGNYRAGGMDFAVAEACEYKKSFLDLPHSVSVVLNIDNDHQDSYADMNDMVNSFKKFTQKTITVLNLDDKQAQKLGNSTTITFGINNNADFMAKDIKRGKQGYSFDLYAHGQKSGNILLKVIGVYNVYNALAAAAVASLYKVPFSTIKSALEGFGGVERRAEHIGSLGNASCYADYAHHPSEVLATVAAFEESGQKTAYVFQPHTFSRTRLLMQDFIRCLSKCENLIIYKTYPARENFDINGSAFTLYTNLKGKTNCSYAEDKQAMQADIINLIKNEGVKRVVFMGAGDIYEIANRLIKENSLSKIAKGDTLKNKNNRQ